MFFKALRLGLIFGYKRIARLRILKDDFLIGGSLILSAIDAIIAWVFVSEEQYQPRLQLFPDKDTGVWICSSVQDVTVDASIPDLVVSLHRVRDAEGDRKGICFGLPATTSAMYGVHQLGVSVVIWIICVAGPIVLFAPAFQNSTVESSNLGSKIGESSGDSSISTTNKNDGQVKAFMFHTGIRYNRATSLWKSAVIMAMPDIDLLILLSDLTNGTYAFSKTKLKVIEKDSHAAKKKEEECTELLPANASVA
ncbi:hypothetical protein HK100_010653, partial [Physocladia obscura]